MCLRLAVVPIFALSLFLGSCARQKVDAAMPEVGSRNHGRHGSCHHPRNGGSPDLSSELVPFQEIDVYAKEAGYVKELNVDYGLTVQRGQVMAVLEIPELEAQLAAGPGRHKAQRRRSYSRANTKSIAPKRSKRSLICSMTRLDGVAKSKPGLVAQQEVDDAQGKDLAARRSGGSRAGRSVRLPRANLRAQRQS